MDCLGYWLSFAFGAALRRGALKVQLLEMWAVVGIAGTRGVVCIWGGLLGWRSGCRGFAIAFGGEDMGCRAYSEEEEETNVTNTTLKAGEI